jgi:hypothetical protein
LGVRRAGRKSRGQIGYGIIELDPSSTSLRVEALRIRGRLLSLKGDPAGAARAYVASLDWARTQQAKSWELRTATSYARLMRDQARAREAYELLASVYGWFTEGFATKDLKEAKTLLDESLGRRVDQPLPRQRDEFERRKDGLHLGVAAVVNRTSFGMISSCSLATRSCPVRDPG